MLFMKGSVSLKQQLIRIIAFCAEIAQCGRKIKVIIPARRPPGAAARSRRAHNQVLRRRSEDGKGCIVHADDLRYGSPSCRGDLSTGKTHHSATLEHPIVRRVMCRRDRNWPHQRSRDATRIRLHQARMNGNDFHQRVAEARGVHIFRIRP